MKAYIKLFLFSSWKFSLHVLDALTEFAICKGLLITASGSVLADGAASFGKACKACHATGAAGSPKLGDKAAWEPRIAQGMDVLER